MTTTQAGIAGNVTDEMIDAAKKIRIDFEKAYGRPCNCSTTEGALQYGRAQGLEIAAALVSQLAQPVQEPVACVACEGNPSGDNVPCAVCGLQPAPSQEPVAVVKALTGDYEKQLIAALSAKMPDGCTVQDYLEDAIPNKESLSQLGINVDGYGLSDIRGDIHQDFYRLLVHTILGAALVNAQAGKVEE